jgi:hypothetical protein
MQRNLVKSALKTPAQFSQSQQIISDKAKTLPVFAIFNSSAKPYIPSIKIVRKT